MTIRLLNRRPVRSVPRATVESMSTTDLLALHERYFGPLDPPSKRRLVHAAATHGWDRGWEMDGLAA